MQHVHVMPTPAMTPGSEMCIRERRASFAHDQKQGKAASLSLARLWLRDLQGTFDSLQQEVALTGHTTQKCLQRILTSQSGNDSLLVLTFTHVDPPITEVSDLLH